MSFFKAIWKGNLRHKKLYDERILAEGLDCESLTESSPEGIMFRAKYLGSTLIEEASNEEATAEAIKTILSMAKAGGRKLQRVTISLGLNGIKVVDIPTEEIHLDISIYRISYCSADAAHSQVFAFIATNANEIMECHAFLCPKRKTAQIMSLTLARVFRTAFDLVADESKFIICQNKMEEDLDDNDRNDQMEPSLLIDFNSDLHQGSLPTWECFDEDTLNKLNHASLWNDEKQTEMETLSIKGFHDMLDNRRWQNSPTNLLCS